MAAIKLPKKRVHAKLDDAIFIDDNRVWIDLKTPLGDLLLSFTPDDFAAVVGEIANSVASNPLAHKPRPRIVA